MSGAASIGLERKTVTGSRLRLGGAGGISLAGCGVAVPIDEGFTIPSNREGSMVGGAALCKDSGGAA